jgi:hypothetical protein
MRHANSNITMNIYTHAISSKKRRAQSKVVEMILPAAKATPVSAGVAQCVFSCASRRFSKSCLTLLVSDLCRDSAPSFGNCLKLRGTDGYQNRALEPQVTIIGP